MSEVEAIHRAAALVQACEASAQRAWRLCTAAMGSPGLRTGQGFSVTPQWALLSLCLEELSLVTGMSILPTSTSTPQLIPLTQPGR